MIPTGPLTAKEIRKTARAVAGVLADNQLESCLFGSAACNLYGMQNRVPQDVDIIVLTDMDTEDIKNLIVEADSRFFLRESANPAATYRILRFSLPPRFINRSCKVDILTPGTMGIPRIPPGQITYVKSPADIPVLPFLPLLLLKLQGWTDHRNSRQRHFQEKIPQDEDDINELLRMVSAEDSVHLRRARWIPRWFVDDARRRAAEFVEQFPSTSDKWELVGFRFS